MREDHFTHTERDAGIYERHRADEPPERPDPSEYEDRPGDGYWLAARDEQVERLTSALRHIGQVADTAENFSVVAHISHVAWAALNTEDECDD